MVSLSCLGMILVGSAQNQLTIDATKQPSWLLRGRGPFPGSATPGHSGGLPIRLELLIPTGGLRSDETTLVDFVITNVGSEPIALPASVDQNIERTDLLTLWFTSDAIKNAYLRDDQTGLLTRIEVVGTSVELYGYKNAPRTFHVLNPNETIRVHASSRVRLYPGRYSFTGHANLARVSRENTEDVGTADAEPIIKTLSRPTP